MLDKIKALFKEGLEYTHTAGILQQIAYGVEKEKALQSITINLAKMLGIDKNYGTLEVGKENVRI